MALVAVKEIVRVNFLRSLFVNVSEGSINADRVMDSFLTEDNVLAEEFQILFGQASKNSGDKMIPDLVASLEMLHNKQIPSINLCFFLVNELQRDFNTASNETSYDCRLRIAKHLSVNQNRLRVVIHKSLDIAQESVGRLKVILGVAICLLAVELPDLHENHHIIEKCWHLVLMLNCKPDHGFLLHDLGSFVDILQEVGFDVLDSDWVDFAVLRCNEQTRVAGQEAF